MIRYLVAMLYPAELTRELQIVLGAMVVIINGAIYAWLWRRPSPHGRRPKNAFPQ